MKRFRKVYCLFLSFIFLIVGARATVGTCEMKITSMDYKEVDIKSYCSGKMCIVKCCGIGEIIHVHNKIKECKKIDVLRKELSNHTFADSLFDYSQKIKIYKDDINEGQRLSTKKFGEFEWVHSSMYSDKECVTALGITSVLVEKGNLMMKSPYEVDYWKTEMPDFCVDIQVGLQLKTGTPLSRAIYLTRLYNIDDGLEYKITYVVTTMLISAFFLLMVLAVYAVLPALRNIQGMLLMAYMATLACTYTLKASSIIYSVHEKNNHRNADCTLITQLIYFFILSTFFWLKIMSFDIWWTFRGTRKLRTIHRRGINVKFVIYACYAFGVPAAVIVFYSVIDHLDSLPANFVRPFFDQCFNAVQPRFLYLYVPLMILTGCNCLLFVMTMYNIWLIKRNMMSFDKSTANKNKKNQNTFILYIKLSSIMGVGWILELVQEKMPDDLWLYIAINSYNMFIGVIIFFMFVFKWSIFLMLCKRFNIETRWTQRHYKVNCSTKSELSKGSKSYSRNKSTSDTYYEEGPLRGGGKGDRLEPEFKALDLEKA